MKSLTRMAVFTAVCLVILCIGGCRQQTKESGASTLPEAEKPQPTLTFRITWKAYSGRGEAIQRIVDAYNNQAGHPYQIQLVDGDEDFSALTKAFESTSTEDLYVLPYRYVQYFGHQKKLVDVTSQFIQDKPLYYERIWDLATVENKVYGIPWLGHSMCLIYNADLLEKSGVDPKTITSMDTWVKAMEKVEASTNARGVGLVGANHNDVSWMVNQFIYGFGSQLVDSTGSTVAINNERSKSAIGFYKDVLGKHAQENWTSASGVEVMDAFRQQKVAFEFQSIWGVTDIWKNGNPFRVGVIPLKSLGIHSEVGPMMLAMPASISEAHKTAAVDFIRFLISRQAQEMIMAGEYSPEHDAYYPFRVPVRKDLADTLVFKNHPEFIPFLQGFENPSVDVPTPGWQLIKDKYYAPGLHKVMVGEMTIDGFLKMIETEGNRILNRSTQE